MSTGHFFIPIAGRFRTERERLGFSRPELAAAMDISSGTVKNWESGTSSPNLLDLAKFHKIGADIIYILTGKAEQVNSVEQEVPAYTLSPSQQVATKVATMTLSAEDADLLLAFARRLDSKKLKVH